MKKSNYSLRALLLVAAFLIAGMVRAQVIVVATAATPGPTPYPTLNDAFIAINAGTHQGVIGVAIMSNTVETGPCVLNASGAGPAIYTAVTIGPGTDGVTLSGPTTSGRGLIELNGADNVIIDGDNPNTGGINRDLTIQNTAVNTTTYASVIRVALSTLITNGDNNAVKNCIILGSASGRNIAGATSTTGSEHTTYGILVGGAASTVTNTNAPNTITSINTTIGAGITATAFTVDNNSITSCARAIAVQGSSVTVANQLTITNNVIGSPTPGNTTTVYSRGMTLQGFDNCTISGNTVQNIESFLATQIQGIGLGDVSSSGTNAIVERNIINHVFNQNTGTFGAHGVILNAGASITVRNNFITDITHNMSGGVAFGSANGINGIRINSGANHRIYYNSVNLFGALIGTAAANHSSQCLLISSTTVTGADVRNNIFSNTISGGTTSIAHVSVMLVSGTSAMNLTLNNNAYYCGSAANQGVGHQGTTFNTLYSAANFNPAATSPATNFRSYTSTLSVAGTNDNLSLGSTAAVPYISNTDLHINNVAVSAPDLDSKAAVIVTIATDIDVAARDASTPDIGADEFALPNCSSANGGTIAPASQTTCAGFTVNMISGGASTGTGISYQWMVGTTSGGPYVNVSGGSGATTTSYTTGALTAGTFYYVLQTTCTFGPLTGLSNELTVTVNPSPTVSVTPTSASICLPGGSPVTLTASGAITYTWLPVTDLTPTTGAVVSANPTTSTTYTVTGTAANGCTSTATSTITVVEQPSLISVSATPSAICTGSNSQLEVVAATTTSYVQSSATFAPINSGTGTITLCNSTVATTPLTSGTLDDGYWNGVAMPFSFNFFGVTYNTMNVQTNGVVSFSPFTTTTGYNNTLPTTLVPNNIIAACFGDLDWRFGNGVISCYTSGVAPNRVFVIDYNGNTGGGFFTGSAPTVFVVTQIQLFETSNVIQIHSANIAGVTTVNHAQGIENSGGTVGVIVPGRNNSAGWTAANDAVQFVPSGGTFTYLWTPSTFLSAQTVPNPMANNVTATTTYTVDVTSAGCTSTGSVTLTVNPLPTVIANATATAVCDGSPVTLSGSGATTYTWTGSVTDNVPFTPTVTDTYTVTGTDGNGCQNTDVITITVNPLPTVTLSGSNNFCVGGSTVLTGSGGGTSQWYMDGVLIVGANSNTYTATAAGVYNMTKTNLNGCSDSAATGITVTVNPLPTVVANASATLICAGDPVTLSGSGATTYTWTGSVTDNVAFNPTVTDTYTVTGTDGNGCQNTDNITVTVNPLPTVIANATATAICTGDPVTLSGSGAVSYTWTGSVTDNVAFNPTATDTYTVTGTDGNGCMNTDNITVTVNPLPTVVANATATTICAGDPVTLSGSGAATYTWTGSVTDNVAFNPASTDTYTVVGTDVNGCMNTDNITVTVNPLPNVTVSFPIDTVCLNGGMVTLMGESPSGGTWSGNGVSGNMFDPQVAGLGWELITYSFTDGNSCTNSITDSLNVDICSGIIPNISINNVTVYPNPNEGQFTIQLPAVPTVSVQVEVMNALGQVIDAFTMTSTMKEVNISELEGGVYFVRINNGNNISIHRVVKQ